MTKRPKTTTADDAAPDGGDRGSESPTDGLDDRDRRAVLELLRTRTVRDAAVAAGMSERTLYRRMTEPAFSAALDAARKQALSAASTRIVGACGTAADVLVAVAEDVNAGASARVTAASKVIEFAVQLTELSSLADRLTALEAALAEREDRR